MPNIKPDELVKAINDAAFECPLSGCAVGRVVSVAHVYKIVADELARQSAGLQARADYVERQSRPHIPEAA